MSPEVLTIVRELRLAVRALNNRVSKLERVAWMAAGAVFVVTGNHFA